MVIFDPHAYTDLNRSFIPAPRGESGESGDPSVRLLPSGQRVETWDDLVLRPCAVVLGEAGRHR
jgi:hypothetical protein